MTSWLKPPDGAGFAVKARITDRVVRLDEITAQAQFTLTGGGPALPPTPMHFVGANTGSSDEAGLSRIGEGSPAQPGTCG